MRTTRSTLLGAAALTSLLAVGFSLLALAVREVTLRGVAPEQLPFAFGHFIVVALLFVWPPLVITTLLLGFARVADGEGDASFRLRGRGDAIGAALGAVGLAGLWLLAFGVGVAEAACWAVIGTAIGFWCGRFFDRLALGGNRRDDRGRSR